MNSKINEIRSKDNLSIFWAGNDGWILGNRNKLIATDLVLEEQNFIVSNNVLPSDLSELDLHFISHEHDDHFNSETCRNLVQHSNCVFVIPSTCIPKAKALEIPDDRLYVVYPGNEYNISGVSFKVIRAFHGHLKGTIYRNASPFDCGYIFQLNGLSIYQPGDTVLLQEHLDMKNIDILFFSSTEHNTYIENSVKLIELIKPRLIIPQHFGTYKVTDKNSFWTTGYPDEVYARLNDDLKKKYRKMSVGELIEINSDNIVV